MNGQPIDHAMVDELAAAYAAGALDASQERSISEHLATCDQPHAEARALIDAAAVLPASLDPVAPSAALRERLMTTVSATPQDHRPAVAPRREVVTAPTARRPPWWRLTPLPTAIAAVALAAAIGIGAWGVSLNGQLADRDAAIGAIASADAIHAASGEAGSGWVIESGGQAMFMAADLAALPEGSLYELWLIGPDGPVAVGTLTDTSDVALITLEQPLGGSTAFAITVEAERVDAPTTSPVLTAELDA